MSDKSASDHISSDPSDAFDVLIVAYKNPRMLEECLRSVATFLPESRIAVWDNSGPEYDRVRALSVDFAEVDWHLDSPNVGFAAAVNRLARTTEGRNFLLLNPDAVLLCDLHRTRELIRESDVAAAAPLIREPGGSENIRSWDVAHRPTGLFGRWVDKSGYAPDLRTSRLGTVIGSLYPSMPDEVSGYLTGACLAINARAWAEVGEFDEEFFLYGEEEQWQRRAVDAGYRLRLADEPGIIHAGHGTVADDASASRRSADLLRANIALNVEQVRGKRAADTYIAGCSLLDRVQRSVRATRASYRRAVTGDRPSVVITTNTLGYGGAERQHALLATELDRRGYHVTIVCIQRLGPLVAEIPASVRVIRQPWWLPMVDVGYEDSVLITGDTNTETGFATLWRAAGRRRRWLVGAHIPPEPDAPTYSAPLARAMARADGFIALSPAHWTEATRHQHLNERVFIAPNGVMSEQQQRRLPVVERTFDKPLRLVMLSRIVEHKNPHVLVQALDGLREFDWELDIFGDGPDRHRLEALTPADLVDRVRWRGWSPGPDHAFADADVVCVPSGSEAFPLVIVEAMARSLPVIATDVCAVGDMLDEGDAGVLVPEPTVDAWRSVLRRIFEDPSQLTTLSANGFKRCLANYTVDAMADAYEEAITGLLERATS
ncbi:glycosyltransferase [Gordonia aichiensis]|uniref:Putative glycosyltransferase n=1 Tax=Gordonia aichiensis NBRC 108223 TaxID=1220583 RepID=L7KDV4_9ACTN|nr:glycosyltransferase [Gordonia aichiensis]GAC47045.1 putative glycosyltransferase [Gordonia aichiensis NBRC 108223]